MWNALVRWRGRTRSYGPRWLAASLAGLKRIQEVLNNAVAIDLGLLILSPLQSLEVEGELRKKQTARIN